MKLSELIRELVLAQHALADAYNEDKTVVLDPLVVLASDEEGNSFYKLYELEHSWEGDQDEPWLVLWPGGYSLSE